MRKPYKSNIIREQFSEMVANEYYKVRLKGENGKAINLDWHALKLLQAYYEGFITENQIEKTAGEITQ